MPAANRTESVARPGLTADAPCLDGHFPGNPIVPGAVLLAQAAEWLAEQGSEIAVVKRMKFLRPLPPESEFRIEMIRDQRSARLSWHADAGLLAEAQVTLAAPAED
ncbi:MAG: hypothetical protein AAGF44_00685 [Pseudomonadota bacterium]